MGYITGTTVVCHTAEICQSFSNIDGKKSESSAYSTAVVLCLQDSWYILVLLLYVRHTHAYAIHVTIDCYKYHIIYQV